MKGCPKDLPRGWLILPVTAFICLASARLAKAETNPGITAAPILQIPLGARAVGMGGAFTGLADDVTALQYNPAGLSQLSANEANFQYIRGLADQNIEYLAFGAPLSFRGFTGSGFSSLAGSLLFSQDGSIQVNTTNPDGSLASSQTMSAGSDFVATVGYSERLLDMGFESAQDSFHVEHFFGVNGKIIHSTLAENYSATAYAADFGYLVRSPEQGWSAGASLLNLGTKMTFISEGDPLPVTARVGVAYHFKNRPIQGQELTLLTDFEYSIYSHQWNLNHGIEYTFLPMLHFRLGYQGNQDLAGLTAGFGVEYEGFTFDYAWAMNSDINNINRVGITYRFGEVSRGERAKVRSTKIETFPEPRTLQELEPMTPEKYELPTRPRMNPPPSRDEQEPVWIY